jgi:DNA-binding transcriptional ArsR family regulator
MSVSQAAVDRSFQALADPTRRRAVELLRARPHRAGELAQALAIALPAMSRHLKALKAAGLVAERFDQADARVRIYALRAEGLDSLKAWLAAADSHWDAQLSAFASHLETGD